MFKVIKVYPEIHQELKMLSALEGRTMIGMLKELLEQYKKSKEEK